MYIIYYNYYSHAVYMALNSRKCGCLISKETPVNCLFMDEWQNCMVKQNVNYSHWYKQFN